MVSEIKSIFESYNFRNVSRETFLKLEKYIDLLIYWNGKLNLISKNTINEILTRHIIDSAQIINYIKDKNIILTDIGSGAGLPGAVVSFFGIKSVNLIEIDQKKCIFLKQVANISDNINIYNKKIEDLPKEFITNIITARALTKINNILMMTSNINLRTEMILLKGESYEDEIIEAKENFDFDYEKHKSITNDKSMIIKITNIKRNKI